GLSAPWMARTSLHGRIHGVSRQGRRGRRNARDINRESGVTRLRARGALLPGGGGVRAVPVGGGLAEQVAYEEVELAPLQPVHRLLRAAHAVAGAGHG